MLFEMRKGYSCFSPTCVLLAVDDVNVVYSVGNSGSGTSNGVMFTDDSGGISLKWVAFDNVIFLFYSGDISP